MKMQIKSWLYGAVLYEGDAETLAQLVGTAVKSRANLTRANLYGANLSGANLTGANLTGANLYGADLTGVPAFRYQHPLQMLRGMTGTITAHKVVNAGGQGPYAASGQYGASPTYTIGESYEVTNANTNETETCGAGINVATLDWCQRLLAYEFTDPGMRVLIVEFTAADIAAIPHASDGKFRLHRCKVVGEWRETPVVKSRDAKGRFVKVTK